MRLTSLCLVTGLVAIAFATSANAMPNVAPSRVTGLVAAVFSPLNASGSLDISVVESQARDLSLSGVRWAFVAGTTGESVDLTLEERKELAVAWAHAGPKHGVRVIIHVGADSVRSARDLAAHAQSLPAVWGIAAMPPSYFKPADVDSLVTTMGYISSAAPNLPFLYYHIPSMTGVNLDMVDFAEAAQDRIPEFAGIKFTHDDLEQLQLLVAMGKANSKLSILFGRDQFLLSALVLGVHGAVGSTYNFAGSLMNSMVAKYEQGDIESARELQLAHADLIRRVTQWSSATNSNGMKELQNFIGRPRVGQARLPFMEDNASERSELRQSVAQWCMDFKDCADWCSHLRDE